MNAVEYLKHTGTTRFLRWKEHDIGVMYFFHAVIVSSLFMEALCPLTICVRYPDKDKENFELFFEDAIHYLEELHIVKVAKTNEYIELKNGCRLSCFPYEDVLVNTERNNLLILMNPSKENLDVVRMKGTMVVNTVAKKGDELITFSGARENQVKNIDLKEVNTIVEDIISSLLDE